MTAPIQLSFASRVAAPPDRVWRWITSFEGINRELRPLLRMTAPRGVRKLGDVRIVPGQRLFRSWILLFGIVPLDRSDLTLSELREGRGFVEASPMLSMRLWRHERWLEPLDDGGTQLHDRLTFVPRLPGPLGRWFVRTLFRHRHRKLRRGLGAIA